MKFDLAGNISSSIRLDSNSPLIEDFVKNVIPIYIEQTIKSYGPPWRVTMKEGEGWNLESLWVNFQKQHEFNPPHDHSGVYSFVIWMQIPTSYAEQKQLPICAELKCRRPAYLTLHFSYTNTVRQGISPLRITWRKKQRVTWLCSPQTMQHQVFPFYENDGERISISGNIDIQ